MLRSVYLEFMVGQMTVGGVFITLLRAVCSEYFVTSASYSNPSAASLNQTLFSIPEEKSHGRPRRRWEVNIKMAFNNTVR